MSCGRPFLTLVSHIKFVCARASQWNCNFRGTMNTVAVTISVCAFTRYHWVLNCVDRKSNSKQICLHGPRMKTSSHFEEMVLAEAFQRRERMFHFFKDKEESLRISLSRVRYLSHRSIWRLSVDLLV